MAMYDFDAEKEKQDLRNAFSIRLRDLREEIGVTQADFAKALGISRATIGYYENGERLPDIAFLHVVCKRTGCNPDYFLNGGNKTRPSDSRSFLETVGLTDEHYEGLSSLVLDDSFREFILDKRTEWLFREIDELSNYGIGDRDGSNLIALLVEKHMSAAFSQIVYDIFIKLDNVASNTKSAQRAVDDALLKVLGEYRAMLASAREDAQGRSIPSVREFMAKAEATGAKLQEFIERDKIEQYRQKLLRANSYWGRNEQEDM